MSATETEQPTIESRVRDLLHRKASLMAEVKMISEELEGLEKSGRVSLDQQQSAVVDDAHFAKAAEFVFTEHAELLRRLAQ